jgi:hypothetical protein
MAACDDPECLDSLKRLQEARNRILILCGELADARAKAATFQTLMNAFLALSAAFGAIAQVLSKIPIIGPILAGIFVVLSVVMLLLAGFFGSRLAFYTSKINDLEQALSDARQDFNNAVAGVMSNCPQECWGDLNQPACP